MSQMGEEEEGHGTCNSEVCCSVYKGGMVFSSVWRSCCTSIARGSAPTQIHIDLFDSESDNASDFEELIEVQLNVSSPAI